LAFANIFINWHSVWRSVPSGVESSEARQTVVEIPGILHKQSRSIVPLVLIGRDLNRPKTIQEDICRRCNSDGSGEQNEN
jgi:hypothetical protein